MNSKNLCKKSVGHLFNRILIMSGLRLHRLRRDFFLSKYMVEVGLMLMYFLKLSEMGTWSDGHHLLLETLKFVTVIQHRLLKFVTVKICVGVGWKWTNNLSTIDWQSSGYCAGQGVQQSLTASILLLWLKQRQEMICSTLCWAFLTN